MDCTVCKTHKECFRVGLRKAIEAFIFEEVAFSLIEGGFCSFVINLELVINSLLCPPCIHNNGSKRLLNTSAPL